MQPIQANNYSIYFTEKGYETLNNFIEKENYSNIFILVDDTTNEFCLPQFLPFLATEKTIEIIEIASGESQKNI